MISESECIYEKYFLVEEIIEEDKINQIDGFFLMLKHRKDLEILKSKVRRLHRVFKVVEDFDKKTSFTIKINLCF